MNVRKQVPEQRGAVVLARLGGALQETPPELGRHGDLYAPALGGSKGDAYTRKSAVVCVSRMTGHSG